MTKLIIENISNADKEFLNIFSDIINNLDKKIIKLIVSRNLKIIIANKLSDVLIGKNIDDIDKYQNYKSFDKDLTSRGLLSNTINAICIFSNVTTKENLAAIFYHEIGHLIDFYNDWENASFSNSEIFKEAYKKDFTKYWEKIKKDKRYRLKHYIQNSTPQKISSFARMETFAHCFARINNHYDDIDILGEYFPETLIASNKIFNNFFINFN